uniref:KIAA0513 n=1 Tax=Panthera tigris altaica TaxID=74533 RepID=A0A8C9KI30_PANTA
GSARGGGLAPPPLPVRPETFRFPDSSSGCGGGQGSTYSFLLPPVPCCGRVCSRGLKVAFFSSVPFREDLDQEEKAKFGEYCSSENGKGREWFARYVSAQRCNTKCVSEATFYRLVQSFAVVLFECHQMDDFGPAKNLMTMCFTYYHIGKAQGRGGRGDRRGNPRLGVTLSPLWCLSPREEESKPKEKPQKTVTVCSPEEERKGEKIYLYTHLKQQPIWHTLRFWNAAFFDAVHCERRKRSPTTREKWCHMTQEERNDSLRFNENITFGQLGTFTHNMLAFGLNQKLCSDFLKKQAVIGNLDEEQYKLLSDHIEQMTAE